MLRISPNNFYQNTNESAVAKYPFKSIPHIQPQSGKMRIYFSNPEAISSAITSKHFYIRHLIRIKSQTRRISFIIKVTIYLYIWVFKSKNLL